MKLTAIVILLATLTSQAMTKTVGRVFLRDTNKNQLFTYERQDTEKDGVITATALYKNPDGSVALKETTVYDNNLRFRTYTLEQKQLNYMGVVKYDNKKVTFELSEKGKKKGIESEKRDEPVIVGALFTLYIRKNWDKLMKGKKINFRLAVPSRQETIGFRFEKVKEKKIDGTKYLTIKMSPSSWLIRQMVDDIYMMFGEDKKLKVYEGRLTVKQKKGSEWKDLDARVYY